MALITVSFLTSCSNSTQVIGNNSTDSFSDIPGFTQADSIIFSTPASENGLRGSLMYVEGELVRKDDISGMPSVLVNTKEGDLWLSPVSTNEDWENLKPTKDVRVFFVYDGLSGVTKTPWGYYLDFLKRGEADTSKIQNIIAEGKTIGAAASVNSPEKSDGIDPYGVISNGLLNLTQNELKAYDNKLKETILEGGVISYTSEVTLLGQTAELQITCENQKVSRAMYFVFFFEDELDSLIEWYTDFQTVASENFGESSQSFSLTDLSTGKIKDINGFSDADIFYAINHPKEVRASFRQSWDMLSSSLQIQDGSAVFTILIN